MTILSKFSYYWANGFRQEDFYGNFPYSPMLNYVQPLRPSWWEVWNAGHNFGRGPPKDHFSKVWLRLAQLFQRRRFFLNFITLFSILSLTAILVGVGITGHTFWRGPPKEKLAQWFLRRRLTCEMWTNGRRTKSDDNSSHGLKARWAKKWNIC